MPEGYVYPKGEAILGKIKQGDLGADVAKRPNDKLNMNPNQKVKQGDLGSESGAAGKKEKKKKNNSRCHWRYPNVTWKGRRLINGTGREGRRFWY